MHAKASDGNQDNDDGGLPLRPNARQRPFTQICVRADPERAKEVIIGLHIGRHRPMLPPGISWFGEQHRSYRARGFLTE